jgi:hypothetical protein
LLTWIVERCWQPGDQRFNASRIQVAVTLTGDLVFVVGVRAARALTMLVAISISGFVNVDSR